MDLTKSHEFFQPEKCPSRIHIIGCGSVGSTVAELLVRFGLTRLSLYDFDVVESKNLANQLYGFRDIGRPKVEALQDILSCINPEVPLDTKLFPSGWEGQRLSGYVFLCADDMRVRRRIVEDNLYNPEIRAMFDFRTRLTDAQHYAADWSSLKARQNFLRSMQFSNEEAKQATPVSACNVPLSVAPTIRVICSYGVANFINFAKGGSLVPFLVADAFSFDLTSVAAN